MTNADLSEELRTRRGQFLKVEKIGNQYNETSLKGVTATYRPRVRTEMCIGDLAFHTKIGAATGTVAQFATGRMRQKTRAIGTEGNYNIFDVRISPEMPLGTAIISNTYAKDGHCLSSSMKIGLSDQAISTLRRDDVGDLYLSEIEGMATYYDQGLDLLLPYWRDHVAEEDADADNVHVEWSFKFLTATHSPKGFNPLLGYFPPSSTLRDVHLANDVSIRFKDGVEHPLESALNTLSLNFAVLSKRLYISLFIIAAALVIVALRMR